MRPSGSDTSDLASEAQHCQGNLKDGMTVASQGGMNLFRDVPKDLPKLRPRLAFAETAGSGQEVALAFFNKVINMHGLVDIEKIPIYYLPKRLSARGKFFHKSPFFWGWL
jgi:hypothetical protein